MAVKHPVYYKDFRTPAQKWRGRTYVVVGTIVVVLGYGALLLGVFTR